MVYHNTAFQEHWPQFVELSLSAVRLINSARTWSLAWSFPKSLALGCTLGHTHNYQRKLLWRKHHMQTTSIFSVKLLWKIILYVSQSLLTKNDFSYIEVVKNLRVLKMGMFLPFDKKCRNYLLHSLFCPDYWEAKNQIWGLNKTI